MSVNEHIDNSFLFEENYTFNNQLYTHLITGRSIHFFIQFVEPELLKLYPEYWNPVEDIVIGYSEKGSINIKKLGFDNYLKSQIERKHSVNYDYRLFLLNNTIWEYYYLLSSLYNKPNNHKPLLSEAYNYISNFGFDFILKLSIGFIVIDNKSEPIRLSNFVILKDDIYTLEQLVVILLLEGAKNFLSLWLKVELVVSELNEEHMKQYFILLHVFSLSILHEFFLRSCNEMFKINEDDINTYIKKEDLLSYLNSLTKVPFSSEIVACWYPFWNRSLFIFNSPFDHKNAIK